MVSTMCTFQDIMTMIIIVQPKGCTLLWEGNKVVASSYPLVSGAKGDGARLQGEHS
jgi:hypothetical protein